jgi:hypothetical protein
MATTNTYKNAKAILRGNTTIYTTPSSGTAILKSIRVSNEDTANDQSISITVTDTSSVEYTLETSRIIQKGTSEELLNSYSFSASPIILQSSEILKAKSTGNNLHIIVSILEMT